MIKFENISKEFTSNGNSQMVLSNINLRVKEKDFITIIGKSGSGKTTLINLIGLIEKPTSGSIYFESKEINFKKEKEVEELRGNYVSFIFQNANLISSLNPIENIMLGMNKEKNKDKKMKIAKKLLEDVGLKGKEMAKINNLSGGEQQRVSVARALANSPKILICDEPTGSLDKKTGETIIELIISIWKETEMSLIVVTHDQDLANLGQRKLELDEGELNEL
ncbi:ABC transporter ATP-binding protein [Facklamia miroungae]|uniref:Putative ABC transport system ATP-binding protein/lipoprotein-releasing system ATP-binding protein n=1 Tax=Facklamia miroungae TaxID=120956 RepID=A0A1G7RFE4_9LACT|nr:ABC transporter ATP-binding protein [Facklamia miroungae]NKZ29431.1 ABC transporter ATP-binding protein [Facklamia miroungae]SDG09546.1 putative ABC transport system ATP-binding protein/lipoprotein-releasing system ATP-binding protein [Facklamia miroungae]